MAFASYEAAAGSRQKKLLYDLLSWEPELRMHEKAVQVALSIAAINREVGAFSATQTWLGGASEHMIRVGVMIERDAEQKVTAHNRRYGKRVTGAKVAGLFDPYPMDSFTRSLRSAEAAVERRNKYQNHLRGFALLTNALSANA